MKLIWKGITDPDRIAAIQNGPKYRVFYLMDGAVMWVLMGARSGKMSCRK